MIVLRIIVELQQTGGKLPSPLCVCVLSFPVCIIPPVSLPLWAWSPSTGSAR